MKLLFLCVLGVILSAIIFVSFSDWLAVRQFKGTICGAFSPRYSSCGRCNMTWDYVDGHDTKYSETMGCFPLCERCWGELTIEERLPYYKALWIEWDKFRVTDQETWEQIKKAVLAGK